MSARCRRRSRRSRRIWALACAFAGSVDALLVGRVVEGLGFIAVSVALPTLLLRIAGPADQRFVMTLWTAYMPAGAGSMMLIAAVVLPGTSWRVAWLVASGASALMLAALLRRAPPPRGARPPPGWGAPGGPPKT